MTPQRKGTVPDDLAKILIAARDDRDRAEVTYRTAVVDALKAGGSVREVARLTGLSVNTVERWGRAGGWPTAAQKQAWNAARQVNRELQARSDAAREQLKRTEGD